MASLDEQAELFNKYYEGVEHPMAGKYWENEQARIYKVASMELRYYAGAGKLQMYVPNNGYSGKAIVLTLGDQTPEELAQLALTLSYIFKSSVSEVKTSDEWTELMMNANEIAKEEFEYDQDED